MKEPVVLHDSKYIHSRSIFERPFRGGERRMCTTFPGSVIFLTIDSVFLAALPCSIAPTPATWPLVGRLVSQPSRGGWHGGARRRHPRQA